MTREKCDGTKIYLDLKVQCCLHRDLPGTVILWGQTKLWNQQLPFLFSYQISLGKSSNNNHHQIPKSKEWTSAVGYPSLYSVLSVWPSQVCNYYVHSLLNLLTVKEFSWHRSTIAFMSRDKTMPERLTASLAAFFWRHWIKRNRCQAIYFLRNWLCREWPNSHLGNSHTARMRAAFALWPWFLPHAQPVDKVSFTFQIFTLNTQQNLWHFPRLEKSIKSLNLI